ncbi:signal peptide peptidase SppA [Facklamia sp. 7083-14-GEN3]|uniref:signal peptide peptidase SppA n=1 Tax=Facklamia sp. 7083-14-GEN3 TaxID=2973478 RepID=UPI00215CD658|nr:signal peptide peptidase SppA [Facklamia sp. 7083-14-GEN3]MCR8969213.1 signal peptide peptidase SppA [Facklamia sp. 7083-14-GEN3]
MSKKKWIVIAFALILIAASSLSKVYNEPADIASSEKWANDRLNSMLGIGKDYTEEIREEGSMDQRILVIPIEGVIGMASPTYDQQLIMDTIEQIRTDESIKAVLFELNTPGGGVYDTREAYDLFKEVIAERKIPVYASMGQVAASGGFYYAMLADKVYATPETITGSIGVIMSGYNMEELYDKIGVEPYVFKSGKMKDLGSSARKMTKEEEEVFQEYIDEAFDRFVQVVVDGRDMSEERVRELADGRIYTAKQAKENGLIDDILYYRQVIDLIREENNLENAQVFEKTAPQDQFSSFFPSFMKSEDNYAEQFDQVLNRVKEEVLPQIEYRWEGGK